MVDIEYSNKYYSLPLIIVNVGSTPLFGRNWLTKVKLNWPSLPGIQKVHSIVPTTKQDLDMLLKKHQTVFDCSLGCYNGPPEQLKVKDQPKFHKPRPVAYAQKPKVEKALRKMEKEGVIKKVNLVPCAAPIVVVGKKGTDDVRICGDFSVTYNKCADVETYPLPKIEDIHEAVRGCRVFSILDINQAYHHIPLTKESQPYVTINTHMGLYSFTRLPNGVHSGPAIFQRVMDTILAGVSKTICYIDDILVAGIDEQDHLNVLSNVFDRLSTAGFKLNQKKCQFNKSSVTYLGHVIDGDGLHPTNEKLKAVQDAPRPKDVTALKSFLGLLMFYSRFLPDHSTVLAPLNRLLKKDVKWTWKKTEEKAFVDAKQLLLESQTLVHYNDTLPIFLSCDASSYGAGAVLSHYINEQFRPIAFASCTLSEAQKNYSQLDKEAFSIIFGIKKFHQYLSGREFTILTDHRPLLSLFAPDRMVPLHVAARLQRWSLILQSYKYKIEYRNITAHVDADSLSRLPLPVKWDPVRQNIDCYFIENDGMSFVSSEMIRKATTVDPVLSKVVQYTMTEWPHIVDSSLVTFKNKKDEITIEQGCLLWGFRVIIPNSLQDQVLRELHDTHPGMTRMKSIARSYVWWPNIDSDIENTVQSCYTCQLTRANPPEAPVHPWCYPSGPWQRLHIDFKGPVSGRTYLVVVDAYSKYPEVVNMSSTTAIETVKVLREIFSRHGLPEMIVSDNGPQFISDEFPKFCDMNGICHRRSAPYKPSTNGQAERIVQVLKSAIAQAKVSGEDIDIAISKYMLIYRTTPHTTTGESPSMLLMKRKLRTRLDLLKPSVKCHVENKQNSIAEQTVHRRLRKFNEGESRMVRNYGRGEKWLPGKISKILVTRNYMVQVRGQSWKRHVDQLQISQEDFKNDVDYELANEDCELAIESVSIANSGTFPLSVQPSTDEISNSTVIDVTPSNSSVPEQNITLPIENSLESLASPKRYPQRQRKPPKYLKDYVP